MKKILLFSVAAGGIFAGSWIGQTIVKNNADLVITTVKPNAILEIELPPTRSAEFLASHFAQSQNEWSRADKHLSNVLKLDPKNTDLLKRAMILAMGGGNFDAAVAHARAYLALDPKNSLAILIVAAREMKDGQTAAAQKILDTMPPGDITDFVRPLMRAWAAAAQGQLNVTGFNNTTIHNYNAALLALYLNKPEEAKRFANAMTRSGTMSPYDAERVADLLAVLDRGKEALVLYRGILVRDPENAMLLEKIKIVEANDVARLKALVPTLAITTPAHGAAVAVFDMAHILYQEQSDASAKIFVQMALALNPDYTEAQLLMGQIEAESERYKEAISYFQKIQPDYPSYLEIQRYIAELYQKNGDEARALLLLDQLFNEHRDIDALINIGDIHRGEERYVQALKNYDRAAREIGDTIPAEYWYLLYSRGMTYERLGEWKKAEVDLKAAMAYQPDQPYLLNYLAYGWADRGINLDDAITLLKRATELRPDDGFITDSLGWALFRMGKHAESIPYLEQAVELMPYDPTLNDHLGDAYWVVGRKREARYQWERAINNADSTTSVDALRHKISKGYVPDNSN